MSVNVSNLIGLVILPCLIVAFFISFAFIIKNKKQAKTSKVLFKFFALCLMGLIAFYAISLPCFKFKINEDFKSIINNVSIKSLNMDAFEFSPYEEYSIDERWVACKESGDSNYNTTVWFVIQPKETYLQTMKTGEGFKYEILEKFCLTEFENEYGLVKVYPVCLDDYHYSFLTMDFYGTIVIPVSHEFDLVIEYICDSDMNECRNYIFSELQKLLI